MFLGLCELYNPRLHGEGCNLVYHYLLQIEVPLEEFYNNDFKDYIQLMKNHYINNVVGNPYLNNKDYENYENIIRNDKYYSLHIVEHELLDTMETICFIHTYRISLLQRKWKKIYKERQRVIRLRMSPKAQFYRSLHGKWPRCCAKYV